MKAVTTLMVFCVGALLALGFVMLYSAELLKGGTTHYVTMQLMWAGLGVVAAGIATASDYRWLKKFAWPLLLVALALLILVLLMPPVKGAHRWFKLGPVSFQPSELAKLALIVTLAAYGHDHQRFMPTFIRGLVFPGIIVVAILVPIFVEPDRGSTILLGAVSGILMVLAGVRLSFIFPPVLCGAAGLAYCLWTDPLRKARILSWLDPENHKQGVGYQVYRSIVGIGSGGVDGLGLGNGRQKAFVPERHTDFIFSVIGEELGLLATLATIGTFMVVVACGIYISRRSRDTFGFLLGSGITFLIGLQAAINIGVVTGALPNKGLPLPFVSYGGSNLLVMMTCIGVLLSIARQARQAPDAMPETNRLPELAAPQLTA